MCFHISQTKKVSEREQHYNAALYNENLRNTYNTPQYHLNGFDHPQTLIIPQEEPSKLIQAQWGLVPANKTAAEIPTYYKQQIKYGSGLNARSEKLFDFWLYKNAALTRRCIIPVTGFFEPHHYQNKKYPIHIKHKDSELLSLAGLYTLVGNTVTYTILTKTASPLFAKIHNQKLRQPVILGKSVENDWLNDKLNPQDINQIISDDYNDNAIEAYAVSRDVFNPRVDSNTLEIIEPVVYEGLEIS
jgi:putative SOS response-associated peptidase YedK